MVNEREKLAREVLTILRDTDQAVGCGAVSQILKHRGYRISEATVGRVLRELDESGYTERAGFRGRLLSRRGGERLKELDDERRGREWGEELAKALRGRTREQLLEVLVARRAVEGELAYLAAVNRTVEEARQMVEFLDRPGQAWAEQGQAAATDVAFHALIAAMARNRILGAAIALIRQDAQLSPVLEYIRRHVDSPVLVDHQRLGEAIVAGQPEIARAVMVEHINNLIQAVEKYWQMTAAGAWGPPGPSIQPPAEE